MSVRFAALTTLFFASLGCGNNDTPTPAVAAQQPAPSGEGVVLKGTLSPSLAPPSSVVVLEPRDGVELPVKSEPAIMDQAGYNFLPEFLIAQAGQEVQFRNSEDVLHNVRVTDVPSQKPVFNVATLTFGQYESRLEPGFYDVTCDLHSTMRASIFVTASPYAATIAEDGSFSLSGVRPGTYDLTIYAGKPPVVRPIEVKNAETDLGVIE